MVTRGNSEQSECSERGAEIISSDTELLVLSRPFKASWIENALQHNQLDYEMYVFLRFFTKNNLLNRCNYTYALQAYQGCTDKQTDDLTTGQPHTKHTKK